MCCNGMKIAILIQTGEMCVCARAGFQMRSLLYYTRCCIAWMRALVFLGCLNVIWFSAFFSWFRQSQNIYSIHTVSMHACIAYIVYFRFDWLRDARAIAIAIFICWEYSWMSSFYFNDGPHIFSYILNLSLHFMNHHVCHLLHLPAAQIYRHNLRFVAGRSSLVHLLACQPICVRCNGSVAVVVLFCLFSIIVIHVGFGFWTFECAAFILPIFRFWFCMRKSRFPLIYQPLWFLRISFVHGKMFVSFYINFERQISQFAHTYEHTNTENAFD